MSERWTNEDSFEAKLEYVTSDFYVSEYPGGCYRTKDCTCEPCERDRKAKEEVL